MMILIMLVVLLLNIQCNHIFQQKLRLILYKQKRTWNEFPVYTLSRSFWQKRSFAFHI